MMLRTSLRAASPRVSRLSLASFSVSSTPIPDTTQVAPSSPAPSPSGPAMSATAAAAAAAIAATPHPAPRRRPRITYSGARLTSQQQKERSFIDQLIRVDHAGELGALRIYQGQLAVLTALPHWWAPGAHVPSAVTAHGETPVEAIEHMLEQEREHLDAFVSLMPARRARPTILAPFWSAAGWGAGAATALAGEKMAMALTSAVEEVITGHYNDQIREIHELDMGEKEAPLRRMLVQFRDDEEEHRSTAIHHKALEAPFYAAFSEAVKVGCKVAIAAAERI